MSIIGSPLVENEDNEVAEQRQHENYLRNKPQVDIQWLPEVTTEKKNCICEYVKTPLSSIDIREAQCRLRVRLAFKGGTLKKKKKCCIFIVKSLNK